MPLSAGPRSRGGTFGTSFWTLQHPLVLPAVRVVEGPVAGQRRVAARAALDHRADLAPADVAEVEGGADALGGDRQAVAGRVAAEEDVAIDAVAELVGDPVALVALGRQIEALGQLDGRVLDVVVGVEAADPDAELVAGREAPAVSGGNDSALDPELEVRAGAAGMDLETARERRVGRLVAVAEDPAPAERVDDQRGRDDAAVGPDRDRPAEPLTAVAWRSARPSTFAVSNSASDCAQSRPQSSG